VANQQRNRHRRYTVQRTGKAARHLAILPVIPPDEPGGEPAPCASDPDALPGCDPVTVAIIDGQPFSRAAMELVVGQTYDFEVVFSGRSVDEFDESGVKAELVVLDVLAAPGRAALDAVPRLARAGRVLVIAPAEPADVLIDAICVGAHGCLTRYEDEYVIVSALRAVAQEALYFCAESSAYLHDRLAAASSTLRC
jgi:DNA-binding NarL/FixJ family response regulator